MHVKRMLCQALAGTILLSFSMFIAACGSSSTSTGSTATGTPTTTAACLSVTTGTIQSVSNTTLQVTSLQGKSVQATLTSKTTFIRQATLTPLDLKTGMSVSVTVKQNPDNSYSALAVSVRNSLTRQRGFTGGSVPCGGRRPRGNGTPGAFGGFGSGTPGSGQSSQTITGSANSQGVINASSVSVLQGLPTRRATPTPTQTTSS